jgi:GTPase SAR1 family protein
MEIRYDRPEEIIPRLQPSKSKKAEFKIVVMGGPQIGKTCFIKRFLYDKFIETDVRRIESQRLILEEI